MRTGLKSGMFTYTEVVKVERPAEGEEGKIKVTVRCEGEERTEEFDQLMHREIIAVIDREIADIKKTDARGILLDAPLLFEANINDRCDVVILITADLDERIDRVSLRDDADEEENDDEGAGEDDADDAEDDETDDGDDDDDDVDTSGVGGMLGALVGGIGGIVIGGILGTALFDD